MCEAFIVEKRKERKREAQEGGSGVGGTKRESDRRQTQRTNLYYYWQKDPLAKGCKTCG